MSPPSIATTPPAEANPDHDNYNGILRSIAVLRSLVMDTSSSNILGQPVPQQQQQQQQQDENLLPDQLSLVGSTLGNNLKDEISRRKTLESAYESLVKFQKQQSNQLVIVIKSRKELEDQLAKTELDRRVEDKTRSQEYMQLRQEITTLRLENKDLHLSLSRNTSHQQSNDDADELLRLQSRLQSIQLEHEIALKEWEDRLAHLQQQLESSQERANKAEKARDLAQDEVRCA
jgi:hypothetical protein